MKIYSHQPSDEWQVTSDKYSRHSPLVTHHSRRAFTLIEIALCLAIIGFALLAVMLVLPYGLGAQRDNREETIIGQDANVLLETIRSGSRGADDLTNYVYAITYSWSNVTTHAHGYCWLSNDIPGTAASPYGYLSNGRRIIGLMSMPEFTDDNGLAIPDLINGGVSNHVVAYARSISGLASEKPPQKNGIMVDDSFTYQIICINAPMPVDTNLYFLPPAQQKYTLQLAGAIHDVRLKFRWPQHPNGRPENSGNVYSVNQVFRVSVASQFALETNGAHPNGAFPNNAARLYFYQPQSLKP